jgi:SAM-dependent methyltransferase
VRLRLRRLRVRLRLRGRRAVSDPDLPSAELLRRQAERLGGMRSRLLRRAGIAHRRVVIDLGAGHGAVTPELARRCGGAAVAVDRRRVPLRGLSGPALAAAAAQLPFRDRSVDLVYAQLVFLGLSEPAAVAAELRRVLRPGGVVLAAEPDFGGLAEHPPALALGDVWRAALARAGADPFVGRKLGPLLASAGFRVRIDAAPTVEAPDDDRFELLADLPLEPAERALVERARAADGTLPAAAKFVHLPVYWLTAEAP